MISKQSTIPGSRRLEKLAYFTFHFWHKSLVLDDVKRIAELSIKFCVKEFGILGESKHRPTRTLVHISGGQDP